MRNHFKLFSNSSDRKRNNIVVLNIRNPKRYDISSFEGRESDAALQKQGYDSIIVLTETSRIVEVITFSEVIYRIKTE